LLDRRDHCLARADAAATTIDVRRKPDVIAEVESEFL
jgi:hypothetical protein